MASPKIVCITQARIGSTRLPGKVLMKIGRETVLEIHLKRALESNLINDFVLATTVLPQDNSIVNLANELGIKVFRGSENDVLDRYYKAALFVNADIIVRITSDCPLIDPQIMDKIIGEHLKYNCDFTTNIIFRTYPDGMDVEVFSMDALTKAWKEATLTKDREHVTYYIWKNSNLLKGNIFTAHNVYAEDNLNHSDLRLTLDHSKDFELLKQLIHKLGTKQTWLNYADFLNNNPSIKQLNHSI